MFNIMNITYHVKRFVVECLKDQFQALYFSYFMLIIFVMLLLIEVVLFADDTSIFFGIIRCPINLMRRSIAMV